MVHIDAPQDQRIAELNRRLNRTYVPYGNEGSAKSERQRAQDASSSAVSPGLLAKRARAKASPLYDNSRWDLVDAVQSGEVALEEVEPEALPQAMRQMSADERREAITGKAAERKKIKQQILELSAARDAYVAAKKREADAPAATTIDQALTSAVRAQGEKKQFQFD